MAIAVAFAAVVVSPALPASVAQAAGSPNVTLVKSMPGEVLYGAPIPVTLSATGDLIGGTDGYNLSFNDVLPEGTLFGSSTPAPTSILPQVDGTTVVVWENVADLLAGASVTLDYTFAVETGTFSIGDMVDNAAGAYAHSNPRTVPDFDPVTGAATGDFTGSDSATASTTLIPFELTKTEPNAEGEILRGVHDHKTAYTLTVDNNQLVASDSFVLVDYLPAGLEYLGCSAVDNSAPGTFEYTGSSAGANRRIDATAHPAMTQCAEASSVTTVTTDPDGAGPLPIAVYTRVEWNTAAIEAAIPTAFPLAPSGSFFIEYAAAIPLRENVDVPLTDPTANLDNNTGALTTDEQAIVNYAQITGDTGGNSYGDSDTLTRSAEDISIHKTVNDDTFVHGEDAIWTLLVESSEYTLSTDTVITVTDSIPNGTAYSSSNTALSAGPADDTATGIQTVEWQIPAYTTPNSSTTITLTTTALDDYRAPRTGPVAANDTWTNSVELTTQATIITANDGSTTSAITLPDASAASQQAGAATILKEVSAPVAGTLTCGDGSALSWDPTVEYDYRAGDRVCWRLTVSFPSQLDTLSPKVKDFLPPGYTFESQQFGPPAIHNLGTGATFDGTGSADGILVWNLDNVDPDGETFQVVVSSLISDASALNNADITSNLMKFSFLNTDGSLFQRRDQADARYVEPILTAAKTATPAGPFVGGDVVSYTATFNNTGFLSAENATIVDTLPIGINCADVTSLGGSSCTDNASPARDTLTWTAQTIPRATEVAPVGSGTVDTAGELPLTYQVTLPGTFNPGASLTNNIAVTSYETPTNSGNGPQSYTTGPTAEATVAINHDFS